jgi:hypothetical protein
MDGAKLTIGVMNKGWRTGSRRFSSVLWDPPAGERPVCTTETAYEERRFELFPSSPLLPSVDLYTPECINVSGFSPQWSLLPRLET